MESCQAASFENPTFLSRVFKVVNVLGISFTSVRSVVDSVYRFVTGEWGKRSTFPVINDENRAMHVDRLSTFIDNLNFMDPEMFSGRDSFEAFNEFCVVEGLSFSGVFVSEREVCRFCNGKLCVNSAGKEVIVYHMTRGTYLASRFTKQCRKCRVQEHYGFYSHNGKRIFDSDCLSKEFLLSTEETVIDTMLLKYLDEEIVHGALPFQVKAKVYNTVHGYFKEEVVEETASDEGERPCNTKKTRFSRNIIGMEKLLKRRCLDRRRLEEAFLLYAVLKIHFEYDLGIRHVEFDRNLLVESVVEMFRQRFLERWSSHRCKKNGCGSVLVLDGNMKNARTVCACSSVGEVKFDGIGGIIIGCPNTPGKGVRYCNEHNGLARSFIEESEDNENGGKQLSTDNDLVIQKIVNNKLTRQGNLCQVEWSNGKTSWVKECDLPAGLRGKHCQDVVKAVNMVQFGQTIKILVAKKTGETTENSLRNHGFAVADEEDNEVYVPDTGVKQTLSCGTLKEKHKAKNLKTAGCLAFIWPCGVIVNVSEMFNCESKSQVYGHLHSTLQMENMSAVDTVCYDDACHLLRYAQNTKRRDMTDTSKRISGMNIVVDKFHFRNHVDKWCQKYCNPYKCDELDKVNTEVCEQTFHWLSMFAKVTKHMNRWRFLFFILYIMDKRNRLMEA